MHLSQPCVMSSQIGDMSDPWPQGVRLCGQSEPGPEGLLEKVAGRSREYDARRSLHVGTSAGVCLARAESDWHVDRDDLRRGQLAKVRLDRAQEVVAGKPAVFENDRDPASLGAV